MENLLISTNGSYREKKTRKLAWYIKKQLRWREQAHIYQQSQFVLKGSISQGIKTPDVVKKKEI